ncbi:MAG: hypothetical protein IJ193_02845 [Bacilli bacterium]|nr:hypothetical protein [Bacilli bacterium]
MSDKRIGIGLIAVLVIICIISFAAGEKKNKVKPYIGIDVAQYLEYLNDSKERIILVGSNTCNFCKKAEPIIQSVMYKYNVDVYYVATNEFTEETEQQFMESNELLNEFSTPLLFVVADGEVKDHIQGLGDFNTYKDFFEKNGFIK